MRRKKRKSPYFFWGFLFLLISAIIIKNQEIMPKSILNLIAPATNYIDEDTKTKVDKVYSANFLFPAVSDKSLSTFIPVYGNLSEEDAFAFANKFNIDTQTQEETDEYFLYKKDNISLYVYKFWSRIRFENKSNEEHEQHQNSSKKITESLAIRKAENFLSAKSLPISYVDYNISSDDSKFSITFISKLDNLPNHSFQTSVTMDLLGNIMTAEYYYFDYDKLSNCKVKNVRDAFYELPTDFYSNEKVNITKYSLIYRFENSILQPAYLFEGKLMDTESNFKHIINAAVFE